MIGAHAGGIDHRYKTIKKTMARCLSCGEYSDCHIIWYQEVTHIFYIKLKVLHEQFIFDWPKCRHRAVIDDKNEVSRYKLEYIDTGILSVPYYQHMQITNMPKKVPWYQFALVILAGLLLGALLVYIKEKLGIPFIP
ncbi:MAG: hypothetical protein WBV22_11835 [Anaerolineaceae bacterium]